MSNRLQYSTSPYLLQHAHNPVDWFPWSDEAWQKARQENKPVLVSIGYSACHWCHVMEREVFENPEAAELMNAHFVCIKVDREERPDVDQVYMSALQLMTGHGGWPLNVFCLPDGRPVFGGTYFPLDRWLSVLDNLLDLHHREPDKLREYAGKLMEGVQMLSNTGDAGNEELTSGVIHRLVEHWKTYWDREHGGPKKAPKFPMPCNLDFLLDYGVLAGDQDTLSFVSLTLDRMAMGGIFDQIGGGFARYSVDAEWKVPHFEKMLYDNAQVISTYSKAYRAIRNPMWRDVVEQTTSFLEQKLQTADGLFYAALDADSEGEEGLHYTWEESELREILGEDYRLAALYYRFGKEGFWEHGKNILLRTSADTEFAESHGMSTEDWLEVRKRIQDLLMQRRRLRVLPGTDYKIITAWNAMTISGYCEAWKSLGTDDYLQTALRAGQTLRNHFTRNGTVHRQYTSGLASGTAFLDDYAHIIEAWLNLYECTSEPQWLEEAHLFAMHVLDHFQDPANELFWYTPDNGEELFVRQKELADNVIPSSNSVMCQVLFSLGRILGKPHLEQYSSRMLARVVPSMDYGASWANWLRVMMMHTAAYHEVIVCGPDAASKQREWYGHYRPNVLFAASTTKRSLPLFEGRFRPDTPVYVCTGSVCQSPVTDIPSALCILK